MNSGIRTKLFIMMVLEFFIWGAWLPPLFHLMGPDGLNFNGNEKALIGSCFAIASVLGIFFSNQFADRTFASEKFLAFSHLVGGIAMLGLYFVKDFPTFFALMLVHSILYVPTISVTNSLAFANLKDANKEFGLIRMGGTIGWILAAWPLYFILKPKSDAIGAATTTLEELKKNGAVGDQLANAAQAITTATKALVAGETVAFIVAGVASLVLAVFCLTLPHTPPKPAAPGADSLAWRKAFGLLGTPFVLVLFIVTFIDATIHNGYFVMVFGFLSDVGIKSENIMPVMSIGQVAEIITMAFLGGVLAKFGWRTTMIVGILGHAARYAVFAFFPTSPTLIIAVQVLHGICYAFFFATVYIFIDAAFPKDIRASAQGLFNLLILGIGDLAAKWIFVPLMENWKVTQVVAGKETSMIDYHKLFLVPVGFALVATVILALFFHPPKAISAGGEASGSAPH